MPPTESEPKILDDLKTLRADLVSHHQKHNAYKSFYRDRLNEFYRERPLQAESHLGKMVERSCQEKEFQKEHQFDPHQEPNQAVNLPPLESLEEAYRQKCRELALYKDFYQQHESEFVKKALKGFPSISTPDQRKLFIKKK
jgi:hypothetical protein